MTKESEENDAGDIGITKWRKINYTWRRDVTAAKK